MSGTGEIAASFRAAENAAAGAHFPVPVRAGEIAVQGNLKDFFAIFGFQMVIECIVAVLFHDLTFSFILPLPW